MILRKRTSGLTAFVLINTEAAASKKVMEALKEIDAVEEAYWVYGIWGIVARIEVATEDKLKEIVSWRLRRLDGVRSTQTMILSDGTK